MHIHLNNQNMVLLGFILKAPFHPKKSEKIKNRKGRGKNEQKNTKHY